MHATLCRAGRAVRFFGLAIIASAPLMLPGCASTGTRVSADQLAEFKPGITTEAEVIRALGEPTSSTSMPDGSKRDTYFHTAASMHAASFIPVYGMLKGGASSSSETVILTFDAHNLLKTVTSSRGHMDSNTGLLNQR